MKSFKEYDNDIITVYHGSDIDNITKIDPKYMLTDGGNAQEGPGIYFGSLDTALRFGDHLIKAVINKTHFVTSRAITKDVLSFKTIVKLYNELNKLDNEQLYYYVTDFGIEINEPSDINIHVLENITKATYESEIRNFSIELAQNFGIFKFIKAWNKIVNISGFYYDLNHVDDTTGFYIITNPNIKVIKYDNRR